MNTDENLSTNSQNDLFSEITQPSENKEVMNNTVIKPAPSDHRGLDKFLIFTLICAIVLASVFAIGVKIGMNMAGSVSVETPEVEPVIAVSEEDIEQEEISITVKKNREGVSSTAPEANDTASSEVQSRVRDPLSAAVEKPVASTGNWTIQIITYVNYTYANEEVRKLSDMGYESFIIPSGKYLQVCVGKFETTKSG